MNYPIGLKKNGNTDNGVGFYFDGSYRFNSPLKAHLKLSFESYTIVRDDYYFYSPDGRSLLVVPSVTYDFPLSRKITSYAGAGLGVSFDNSATGVFNKGFATRIVAVPQVGVRFFNRINVSAQYVISKAYLSRMMIGVGYIF